MARPVDAALKELIGAYPQDWVRQLGLRIPGEIQVVDAELSTISAEADKLLRLEEPSPWLLHLELQSGADPSLDERILRYNVLIRERHRIPVHSALFFLRPQAEATANTGSIAYETLAGAGSLDFRYQRVRVWELPMEQVLEGGVGTLPLAPLSAASATCPCRRSSGAWMSDWTKKPAVRKRHVSGLRRIFLWGCAIRPSCRKRCSREWFA